jgi:hypothetical protein
MDRIDDILERNSERFTWTMPQSEYIAALRARIEELTIPADVLADLLDIVTSYCADREYFGKGYNWLTAYKEARG